MAISQKRLDELKIKYTGASRLDIPVGDNDEIETLIIRRLDRVTYKAMISLMEKDDLLACATTLRALTVEGDAEKVCNDFEALRTAQNLLVEVITPKVGNVAKL